MKYFDAFAESGYHSAFITTFSFGASAFEEIALPRLWSAGCRNVHVIADEVMLNQEFTEYGPPRRAGTHYHLIKEKRDGAFHPKIMLQLGRDRARLMIGSANLTAPGLSGNLELVSVINCVGKDDVSAPVIFGALRYISDCVTRSDTWFSEGIERAVSRTPWLSTLSPQDSYLDPLFGLTALIHDQARTPCLDQFVDLVGDDVIQRLTVVSPFWDNGLVALARLRQQLGNPPVRAVIEKDRGLFPRDAAVEFNGLSIHDLTPLQSSRRLHAKLFIAEGKAFDHVLSGSMNCSVAAMMHINDRTRNAEIGLYRRVKAGASLGAMGLTACLESRLEFEDLPPFQTSENDIEVDRAAIDGGKLNKVNAELYWQPPESCEPTSCRLSVHSLIGSTLLEDAVFTKAQGDNWRASLSKDPGTPCFGIIHFSDDLQSAPVVICDLVVLPAAAKEVYRGDKAVLLSALDGVVDENPHILEILISLQQLSDSSIESAEIVRRLKRGKVASVDDAPSRKLTYQVFIAGRDTTNKQRRAGAGHLKAETYLSDVRHALNRIIGIVAPVVVSPSPVDQSSEVDLAPTEPIDEETANAPPIRTMSAVKLKDVVTSGRHERQRTADDLKHAVQRFTNRMSSEKQSAISLSDLVHLRALLQIILAFGIPRNGDPTQQRVLPAYESSSLDWSRLIGQVIRSLYLRGDEPFASLEVPDSLEEVPDAVLECWAAIVVSLRLAISVTKKEPKAAPVTKQLENLQALTAARIKREISENQETYAAFMKFLKKFEDRFEHLKA